MDYRFDVAISFAGPEREYAGSIARIATANGLKVFFDEYYVAELWGKNLVETLTEIYERKARFCVVLISRDYVERAYTTVERRSALDRAIQNKMEYILPVVTDDCWLEGLPKSTAYLDLRKASVAEVGQALVRKIKNSQSVLDLTDDPELQKVIKVPEFPPLAFPTAREKQVTFVQIRLGKEVQGWKEAEVDSRRAQECAQAFIGQVSGDPVFDITIMNRFGTPVLLTAVGLEVQRLDLRVLYLGGAWRSKEIKRSRTFFLELPDLWAVLAEHRRSAGETEAPVHVRKSAYCRLPNPVLLDADMPYRFGLVLCEYQGLVPNLALHRFCLRTDVGEMYSPVIAMNYIIPGDYGGLNRYLRMLQGLSHEEAVRKTAERRWLAAGRPVGRDEEFWFAAEEDEGLQLRKRAL